MIEITLSFSDEQAQKMKAAVMAEAQLLAVNPDVRAKLPPGTTPAEVAEWPIKKQARLVLYASLMFVWQRHDREAAALQAGDEAGDAARDAAPLELE